MIIVGRSLQNPVREERSLTWCHLNRVECFQALFSAKLARELQHLATPSHISPREVPKSLSSN